MVALFNFGRAMPRSGAVAQCVGRRCSTTGTYLGIARPASTEAYTAERIEEQHNIESATDLVESH